MAKKISICWGHHCCHQQPGYPRSCNFAVEQKRRLWNSTFKCLSVPKCKKYKHVQKSKRKRTHPDQKSKGSGGRQVGAFWWGRRMPPLAWPSNNGKHYSHNCSKKTNPPGLSKRNPKTDTIGLPKYINPPTNIHGKKFAMPLEEEPEEVCPHWPHKLLKNHPNQQNF